MRGRVEEGRGGGRGGGEGRGTTESCGHMVYDCPFSKDSQEDIFFLPGTVLVMRPLAAKATAFPSEGRALLPHFVGTLKKII